MKHSIGQFSLAQAVAGFKRIKNNGGKLSESKFVAQQVERKKERSRNDDLHEFDNFVPLPTH